MKKSLAVGKEIHRSKPHRLRNLPLAFAPRTAGHGAATISGNYYWQPV